MLRLLLLPFLSFFVGIASAYADAIPDDSRSINRCVMIGSNIHTEGIEIRAVVDGPVLPETPDFVQSTHTCISKGYKFNGIKFYWRKKGDTNSGTLIQGKIPDIYGGYVNERDPLMAEKYIYVLEKSGTGYVFVQESYTPTYSREYVIKNFFLHLGATLITEIFVLFMGIYYFFRRKDIKKILILLAGILASSLTLPVFWHFLPFGSERVFSLIFLCESTIVLVEMAVYSFFLKMKSYQLFLLSVVANIASIIIGKIL